jgi:hypothetical protein
LRGGLSPLHVFEWTSRPASPHLARPSIAHHVLVSQGRSSGSRLGWNWLSKFGRACPYVVENTLGQSEMIAALSSRSLIWIFVPSFMKRQDFILNSDLLPGPYVARGPCLLISEVVSLWRKPTATDEWKYSYERLYGILRDVLSWRLKRKYLHFFPL